MKCFRFTRKARALSQNSRTNETNRTPAEADPGVVSGEPSPAPPTPDQTAPNQSTLAKLGIAIWIRNKPELALPVLIAVVLAILGFVQRVLSRGINRGYADVYRIPSNFRAADNVSDVLTTLLFAGAVSILLLVVLPLAALCTKLVARVALEGALVISLVLAALKDFSWSNALFGPGIIAFEFLVIEIFLYYSRRPGKKSDEITPTGSASPHADEEPGDAKPPDAGSVAQKLIAIAGIVALPAVLVSLATILGSVGINNAGDWFGRRIIGPYDGSQQVVSDVTTDEGRTVVLVFSDGDQILERPMFKKHNGNGYFPCGTVNLKPVGEEGVDFRTVDDFGPVISAPASQTHLGDGSQSNWEGEPLDCSTTKVEGNRGKS